MMMQYLDKRVNILLAVAFIVQMLTAWHTFFFHSDEYFQVIEFTSYKLGISPASMLPWEFKEQIRPSIQPYIFKAVYLFFASFGIKDRFFIFAMVHIGVGIVGFALCNYLLISKFKKEKYLFHLLLIANFLGLVPFLRSSFSAETMGGLSLLLSILLLEKTMQEKSKAAWAIASGLCMGFCFFFRFPMAAALVGILVWIAINHIKKWDKILLIGLGFAVGCAFNIYLDTRFYGNFCFTPYNYFYANIIQGKAAGFGTSPWWYYIPILAAVAVPLLSLFLFGLMVKSLANYKNPYSLAILFLIVGHSLIGHKEERFLFPVLFFMVYLAGDAYRNSVKTQAFIANMWGNKQWGWLVKGGIGFSAIVNLIVVVLLCITPFKQPMEFIKKINSDFPYPQQEIFCYKQSPYTTESNLPYHFLAEDKLKFTILPDKASFLAALASSKKPVYYCLKYEDAAQDGFPQLIENKKGIVSSSIVWWFTNWVGSTFHGYIQDIWLLASY
ncbi:hypothetical protein [Parasediminibacterium sp. JCM 36343]|uniref:hypothetical protein n=1 Tax=Parasediminibacterium sp. JCM 36343 TaxID=3374279 RepID=UPI00397D4E8F